MKSILSELYELKSAAAPEISRAIEELAETKAGFASGIRMVLNPRSNGKAGVAQGGKSDTCLVQVALLAILVDEISYNPSSTQRNDQLDHARRACEALGVDYEEVVFVSRKASLLTEIFNSTK